MTAIFYGTMAVAAVVGLLGRAFLELIADVLTFLLERDDQKRKHMMGEGNL